MILAYVLMTDRDDPETEEFEFVPINLVESHVDDVVPLQPLTLPEAISDQSLSPPAKTVADETSTQTVADVKAHLPPHKIVEVEQAGFEKNHPRSVPGNKSRVAWLTGEIEEFPQPDIGKPVVELDQYPFKRQ